MKDGQRVYPVNKTLLHHAVSDEMRDWDDIDVQDWFSGIGKARGYNNGAINSYHEHPSRPGQLTYSMAHFCLHPYTKDGNKYGWRLTELIKLPWDNVAWHAGNWAVNQQSIGIETAGNYVGHRLDEKALMLVADAFRAQDQALGGALELYGHKDFFATACPGQIYDQIGTLIDMINDPNKWNNILWPSAPAPVIRTEQKVEETVIPFTSSTIDDPASKDDHVVTAGVNGKRSVTYEVTYTNGVETARKVVADTTQEPINEVLAHGTFVEPAAVEVPSEPAKTTTETKSQKGNWIVLLLIAIAKLFSKKK